MHGIKHTFHAIMMFHCFVTLPAALIFCVYSIGAMILLGAWQLFLWGVAAMFFGVVILAILAVLSE